MGMIYRTDVFKKYGITPPTTWDEFAAAAAEGQGRRRPRLRRPRLQRAGPFMALQIQKGAVPFGYDPAKPQDLTDQAQRPGVEGRAQLLGRPGRARAWSASRTSSPPTTSPASSSGKYATYVSAAWAPGYLTGAGVGKGQSKGVWAAAPLPQWDPANPVSVNWGGSAFAVTTQASDKKLAAIVAKGIYADPNSLEEGWKKQTIFPLNKTRPGLRGLRQQQVGVLQRAEANKDIYIPAGERVQGHRLRPDPDLLLRPAPGPAGQDQRAARRRVTRRPTTCRPRSSSTPRAQGFKVTE